ncbi:hypothetical protein ABZX88_34475 [Kitasatospora aureofaciens]|uniref:hypothetical protein n=1 Tax=Kitasatospora aureofaciens TaxID=1894 RepID=UPI0033AC26BA
MKDQAVYTGTHPAVLLARAIGLVLGIIAYQLGATVLWAGIAGMTAYAVTLISTRGTWPRYSATGYTR